ncbi:diacylglycerol kinase [Pedobacter africanus]|uniref:Undecaprenol kinase n=1 Tax=Pedobacter africanus TaxID=151894 RepID=A0A1W2AQ19_9SPHI|nr:diacylglycerol kinase family protein [Pedobacter africanus]SMC62785.1 undecaprenol kinase [Pedobacter africanus]
MSRFIKSFGYAFSGLGHAIKTQLNFRVHLLALALVTASGYWIKLTITEWLWIIGAAGMVLVTELLNTAIEVLTDLVSPELHPKAKIIKDVSAAAVLVAALTAVAIGLIILIPKLLCHAA